MNHARKHPPVMNGYTTAQWNSINRRRHRNVAWHLTFPFGVRGDELWSEQNAAQQNPTLGDRVGGRIGRGPDGPGSKFLDRWLWRFDVRQRQRQHRFGNC